jgi:20S proteasome alpha/beta subunit
MPLNSTAMLPSQEPKSIEKVAEIDSHIGCAMSGLTADARTLIDHARVETQVNRRLNLLQLQPPQFFAATMPCSRRGTSA